MTTAELYLKYHLTPLPKRVPVAPEVSSPEVVVLTYVQWISNRCAGCKHRGASGIYLCLFSDDSTYICKLCADCGLNARFMRRACGIDKIYPGGWGAPRFVTHDLLVTLTFQSRTEVPPT